MSSVNSAQPWRARTVVLIMYLLFFAIIGRLFYWQIIKGSSLQLAATEQYLQETAVNARRGSIYTSDGYLLVGNEQVYRVFAEPHILDGDPAQMAEKIAPLVLAEYEPYLDASEAAQKKQISDDVIATLSARLIPSEKSWSSVWSKVSQASKEKIEMLELPGIGFDPYLVRSYPEASLSAHITGFVGKDAEGNDQGYFGIEGSLDKELRGRAGTQSILADALGNTFQSEDAQDNTGIDGRDVTTTIRRDIQLLLEKKLLTALRRYGAKSGEIIVMEPGTGKIRGLASYPNYVPNQFYAFPTSYYKNPSLTNLYEPGSTFKVLTVAAGIDSGAIKPDTECPNCSGPRQISGYTIKTWNDEYHPNITMTEALAKSDNIAMISIVEKIGSDKFQEYLQNFGLFEPLGIELQEDIQPPLLTKWGPVELATRSFGQGILTSSMHILSVFSVIANEGRLIQPTVIDSVTDPVTNTTIETPITEIRQVISPSSAQTTTEMMITAAHQGEAQWTAPKDYQVAAKTGTSQVSLESGGYSADKTIASFVGFAPAHDPKFIMLVRLDEPTTSPWAAETAAPLWYDVADELLLLL